MLVVYQHKKQMKAVHVIRDGRAPLAAAVKPAADCARVDYVQGNFPIKTPASQVS